MLVQEAKKSADAMVNPSERIVDLLQRLDDVLLRLDQDVHMNPEFKEKTQDHKFQELICDDKHKFSQMYIDKAKALLEKWQGENWGAPVAIKRESGRESDGDGGEASESASNKKRQRRQSSKVERMTQRQSDSSIYPAKYHLIWGQHGIYHGLYRKVSPYGKASPALDPRYQKYPANVFGHNRLQVGAWFPLQLAALFKGAHGKSKAGIYGTEETGAWSIVVSGGYEHLDNDLGTTLYYSGSRSHENTDPKRPGDSSRDTLSLHTSLTTQRPVRVLRSSKGKPGLAPTAGLRYDGLYQVVNVRYPRNDNGGMYEQFKLVRLDDQEPINKFRPNPRELEDYERMGDRY